MSKKEKKKNNISTSPFVLGCLHFSGILSKIALVSFALTFLYLTLVFWGESIRNFSSLPLEDQKYYFVALRNTVFIFDISVIGILIFTTICNFTYDFYSKILLLVSLIFAYGLPYVFVKYTPISDFQNVYFLSNIVQAYSDMGKIALFLAIILYAKDLYLTIANAYAKLRGGTKQKSKPVKRKAYKLGNNCWDSGYCTPELRDLCPAFLLKKPCWKLGIGCCDATIFLMSAKTDYAKHLLNDVKLSVQSKSEKLESCRKCHIFLVHQRRKYKQLVPVILVISAGIGYLVYEQLWYFFENAITQIDKFARFLMPNSGSITDTQLPFAVMVGFMVAVSILLAITLMVQLLHYSIFKLKL